MNNFDLVGFIVYVLSAGIMAGTPILLASLGEIVTQRSGVMNIGVEGMMLVGAIFAFMFTNMTGSRWLGLLGAMGICAILSLILGLLLIQLRANQVATGMAFIIFCSGLSSLVGKPYLGEVAKDAFSKFSWTGLEAYPRLRQFLQQDEIVIIAIAIAILLWFVLYRTRWGLYIRAAGDNPAALDCVGVNIYKIRYLSLILGGMLCGMGGAYLSTGYSLFWIENMTAGRGWLAIALVNFSLWNPLYAILGAYIFGVFHILSLRLETLGIGISPYYLRMIPYFLPIIVLIIIKKFSRSKLHAAPQSLGLPYYREGK